MKDFLGQEIRIGDKVVYPNRQGSRLWMNSAYVMDINNKGIKVDKDGVTKQIVKVERVVVIADQRVE